MATLIPDGLYNVQNIAYPGSVLNLTGGLAHGAVTGFPERGYEDSSNLRWFVKNVGNNQITLENGTARGYYVGAPTISKGAPLVAVGEQVPWTVIQISEGLYVLETAGLQWTLTTDGENGSVFLGPIGQYSAAGQRQWKFRLIPPGK